MKTEVRKIGGISANLHAKLHHRLRKKHGSATRCEHCKDTTKKHYQWALKKGHTYSDDPADYLQLCTSCHRKYDFTEEIRNIIRKNRTGKFGGSHNSAKPIVQLDRYTGAVIKEYGSLIDAEHQNKNFKSANIGMCLIGKNQTAYGYKWKYAS